MAESYLLRKMPELRPAEAAVATEDPDGQDGKRVQYVKALWQSQTWALSARDSQIEENVRMLAGQHWTVKSDLLNKWVDIDEYLTDEERRWRQRPVVNRLLFWFMLTHARATENPPVITFQPDTLDRADAELSEVMDTIYKSLWHELDMLDVWDRIASWLIPGGIAYCKTRIDPTKGSIREWVAPSVMQLPNGQEVVIPATPFNAEGQPLVELFGDGTFEETGKPFHERTGDLDVAVLSALEVRAQWGPMPFHKKRWYIHRSLLTPEEVFDLWGVEVEPDTFEPELEGNDELRRLLFGSGYFGAAGNSPKAGLGNHPSLKGGFVMVDEFWHVPSRQQEGMEETLTSPGGRLTVVANQKVFFDGARPAFFKSAGPIQQFEFVRLPGRPNATSPQEMLNPLQRTYNRGYAQILEHRNLSTNPVGIVDDQAGIEPEEIENKPGLILKLMRRASVPAFEYVQPPRLGDDVYKVQAMLAEEINFLGQLQGTEGEAPTRDASGELVKELRFNTDRFLGPTMRRAVGSLARVVEDWIAYLPVVWDEEKIIAYAGEDQVARTVTVMPQMFVQGKIHVRADIESMLPEGRGERQNRVFTLYAAGLLGDPADPQTQKKFFDLAKFPHMGRTHRPGGIHRVTAEQENGRIVRGALAAEIPVLEWYDHEEHLFVHEQFMSSPEYLKLDPIMQLQFAQHRADHQEWLRFLQAQQLQAELELAALMAEAQEPPQEAGEESQGGRNGTRPRRLRSGESPANSATATLNRLPDRPRGAGSIDAIR